jgi:hypothetical protein
MNDPRLGYKLSRLDFVPAWKTRYQKAGQELHRVNFYPDDQDWGRLSAISNATGYSRCFIFVFLMLVYFGVIDLGNRGTVLSFVEGDGNPVVICSIRVDLTTQTLMRMLKT